MKKRGSKQIVKRILASVMSLSMVLGEVSLMPSEMQAQAATDDASANELGTGLIGNPVIPENSWCGWSGSYVYYGRYDGINPNKYRVLDKASEDFGVEGGSLLLDCDSTLYNRSFHATMSNVWASSDIKKI